MTVRIARILRYPVKSMAGEDLSSTLLGRLGIPGDRAWALHDRTRGRITGAKQLPALMSMHARFLTEPDATRRAPGVVLRDGHGSEWRSTDPDVDERLSAYLEHAVALRPVTGSDDFFDAFPLLILSTSALAALQQRARTAGSDSCYDVRRFRPSLLLETAAAGFPEDAWCGRELRVGTARVRIDTVCPRCVMTTHAQHELPRDPSILRTLMRERDGALGVYASVLDEATIAVGDPVALL